MRGALILAIPLLFSVNANAAWNERSSADRLTGKKTIRMETSALAPISHYGRTIVPKLSLQCLTPSDRTTPYIGAFIIFGELVAVVPDARMRLRIDDGEVENRLVGLSPRADHIQLVVPEAFVFDRLRNSSRVRVEVPLLDNDAFMEFNTKGTLAAINKIGC
jgi:hypothetical protein